MPEEALLRGIGVVIDAREVTMACVGRLGARWIYHYALSRRLSGAGIAGLFKRAYEVWGEFERSKRYIQPADWFAIRDTWGLVAGSAQETPATLDARRQVLMMGQAIQWAVSEGIEPVLFEPSSIKRGLGAQVDSDDRRLADCVRAMVNGCPRELAVVEAVAVATAIMGGRHHLAPAVLTKGKRL